MGRRRTHGEHDTYQSDKGEVSRLQLRREERSKTMPDRKVPAVAVQDGETSDEGYRYRQE